MNDDPAAHLPGPEPYFLRTVSRSPRFVRAFGVATPKTSPKGLRTSVVD